MAFRTDYIQTAGGTYFFVVLFPVFSFNFKSCLVLFFCGICSGTLMGTEFRVTTKLNIGTTTGHVCCNCNSPLCTGFRNNHSFAGMVLCVQNFMADSLTGKKGRKMFRFFNWNSTNENRLTFFMSGFNFCGNCFPLVLFVQVNLVVFVLAGYREVCRNSYDIQTINLIEFNCFGCGCTGHTRKLVVHTEEVLEGDCCHCSVSLSNFYVLLCFNSLV